MRFEVKEASGFQPLELTITFDKVSQLNAFYAIFAHSDICDFLRDHGFEPEQMRHEITGKRGEPDYNDAFKKLREIKDL